MSKLEKIQQDNKVGMKNPDSGEIIIPIIYRSIEILGNFIKCFDDAYGSYWYFNTNGEKICCGHNGKLLSDNLITVRNAEKWGVIDSNMQRIVNFMYDNIRFLQNKFVVTINNEIGVLDTNGSIIINPAYQQIECVNINDEIVEEKKYSRDEIIKFHGEYNKECKYNSKYIGMLNYDVHNHLLHLFMHKTITPNDIKFCDMFNFDCTFILTSNDYCELFTIADGIIPNSRFDSIEPLTNKYYVVKSNEKFGIFNVDNGKLIFPCELDCIVYEGGNVVLLQKNDLWGAVSLETNGIDDVNIPINYTSISILNSEQTLFQVPYDIAYVHNYSYTIIDKDNGHFMNVLDIILYHGNLSMGSFKIYTFDKILTSANRKYGFINANGYISIPFKYDEIIEREDNYFDVRIDKYWGILDSESGREITSIKYAEKIPQNLEYCIVKDAITGCLGMLGKDGAEIIPPLYNFLKREGVL